MVASDPKLAPGTVVLGKVRVEEALTVAGVGALHRGRTTSSSIPFFVRAMSSRALMRATDSLAREVLVVRHVEHDGVVPPRDAGVEGTRAFVAYEPTEGALVAAKLPPSEVARIALEIALILDHAHRQPAPIVHGSLSRSSVVVAGSSVRLLDLGLVQALERVRVLPDALWDVMDPAAASPEQVSGTFPISAATDVFGLASLVFECLTGRAAFPATNEAEAEALIVAGKRPRVQAELDRLLAKAWSVDPRSRPHDIVAFARELGAALLRPSAPALESAGPTQPGAAIHLDDDAIAINVVSNENEEPTLRGEVPKAAKAAKSPRAMTLPFGLPTPAPQSDPPPSLDKATVPKIAAAKPARFELGSEPPPPAPAPQAAPAPPPPPPPPLPPDVQTVKVVNVTALIASLVVAGGLVLGGAFVGGSALLGRRTDNATPIAPPPPSVVVTAPSVAPVKSTPPPVVTAVAPVKPPEPTPAVASVVPSASVTSTVWPELPKEPGPRPSAKAMEHMRQKLRTAFEPCLKLPPKMTGIPWMVHFELDGATGQPMLVELSRPFKGTLAGACMMRAALDARVPPFDAPHYSIDVKFGP